MLFLNRIFSVLTLVILAGCGAGNDMRPDASAEVISSASYRHDGPAALTLYTMINNRSGAGAHSSVMINGSQRVIFDPAGTVRLSAVPERGDVLYGITPQVADFMRGLMLARPTMSSYKRSMCLPKSRSRLCALQLPAAQPLPVFVVPVPPRYSDNYQDLNPSDAHFFQSA